MTFPFGVAYIWLLNRHLVRIRVWLKSAVWGSYFNWNENHFLAFIGYHIIMSRQNKPDLMYSLRAVFRISSISFFRFSFSVWSLRFSSVIFLSFSSSFLFLFRNNSNLNGLETFDLARFYSKLKSPYKNDWRINGNLKPKLNADLIEFRFHAF